MTERRHVVLVGLPGSGKTTAGRLAAAELGAPFDDLDAAIVRLTGSSVAAIFAGEGEAAFRAHERRAMAEVAALPPRVVAPGGGWVAQPGNLEALGERGIIIRLEVTPATAAHRLATGPGEVRPLLAGRDPVAVLRELAAARAPFYRRARAAVDTEHLQAADVAGRIVALARSLGGW